MNHTKNNQNKLEKLRGIFFQIGLIIAGGLTLLAFEWTSPTYVAILEGEVVDEMEWDYNYVEPFEIIKEEVKEEKVEPPKVKSNEIEIVPDDKKIIEPEIKDDKKVVVPNLGELKDKEVIIEEDIPTPNPGKMPEFKGGLEKLFEYLGKNIKYPEKARRAGIEGKVYLQFVVGKKGEIRDIKILRGVNKWLDEEAIRVVKAMPNWKPGKQRGKPVSVIYNLPINFKLKG